MMNKFKDTKKRVMVLLMAALTMALTAVPVLASGGDSGSMASVETALTGSFTEIGGSLTSIIGKVLPIALPIIGAVMVVVLGIGVFKKITGKAK